MISDQLAQDLALAGVRWDPKPGDQFRISAEALSEDVFTLSHMVIEPRTYDTGTVLHFNGTTEWALDSIAQDDTLWLPREDQLREMLGGTFRSLERDGEVYVVTTDGPDGRATYRAAVVEDAYAGALLALVHHAVDA
ncbi:pilus assembly protein CpaE [Occultella glacieicola]|uniref:Pilus assembly protein CpaE n=1 Tax=Occultella glacieicola TaxID=2518684 RepID=A0ABY2E7D8_9MICO|nr:pilus assembly protein CpaE [Occultella glacieicola]TDE95968.1 pilus assembly protein CpaE [Occultella glacieicola]